MAVPPVSRNLWLAAVVSLFVHVPFAIVARVSLIAAAVVFVVDPLPPYSRVVAIVSCWMVLQLTRMHRGHEQDHEQDQDDEQEQDEARAFAAGAMEPELDGTNDDDDRRGNETNNNDSGIDNNSGIDTKKDL